MHNFLLLCHNSKLERIKETCMKGFFEYLNDPRPLKLNATTWLEILESNGIALSAGSQIPLITNSDGTLLEGAPFSNTCIFTGPLLTKRIFMKNSPP